MYLFSELFGQLFVLDAEGISQGIVVGFSFQSDAQFHHLVLHRPQRPHLHIIYLVSKLNRGQIVS